MEAEPGSIIQFTSFLFILLNITIAETFFGFLAISILLFLSGLISSSEVAFFSFTPNDIEKLEQENRPSSQRILKLKDQPRYLLATILISNNFINVAIVILSDYLLGKVLPPGIFDRWANGIIQFFALGDRVSLEWLTEAISFAIVVVGVTFFLVLFGEVAPKVYARFNNIPLARFVSSPMVFLMRLFSPISSILVNWTWFIEKRLSKTSVSATVTSRKDIDEAIELTVSGENDSDQEMDILKSIVKFGDVSVKQIMRSRVDVVTVDFRIGYNELLKVVKESGFSRIPVHDEDFDHVTGILYVKDLIGHLNENADFEWQKLIRTNVLYVPEAKKIDDLLREFQRKHLHLAIVVDEYGGSSGIATLEDIMEEVIGEIRDEFDSEVEVIYKKIDDFNFLFEGKTLLNDVCRIAGLDTSTFDEIKGEADSIAGMILEVLGAFPQEEKEIHYNQFKFKIVSVSSRRIEQILMTLPKAKN